MNIGLQKFSDTHSLKLLPTFLKLRDIKLLKSLDMIFDVVLLSANKRIMNDFLPKVCIA